MRWIVRLNDQATAWLENSGRTCPVPAVVLILAARFIYLPLRRQPD